MTKFEFKDILSKLETYFPKLDESQEDIYFDSLKQFSSKYSQEACQYLYENCKYKHRFPSAYEIIDAFTEVYNNAGFAHPEELINICPECEGEGMIIQKGELGNYNKAVYCKCQTGRERFEAHGRYFDDKEHYLFTWKEKQIWEAYKRKRRIK